LVTRQQLEGSFFTLWQFINTFYTFGLWTQFGLFKCLPWIWQEMYGYSANLYDSSIQNSTIHLSWFKQIHSLESTCLLYQTTNQFTVIFSNYLQ
jgi:hypothetical protein